MLDRRQLIIWLVLLMAATAPADVGAQLRVTRVIDGDTFELSDGQKVRLIGIDTPEKHPSAKLTRDAEQANVRREVVQALGEASSDYARMLAQDRPVELEYDQANAASRHRDRYGRTLAYVWVLDGDGQRAFMVNRRLVADGYANAYTSYPFAYAEEFRRLERSARERQVGLWDDDVLGDAGPAPRGPSEGSPASSALVGSSRGEVFHLPSCRHAKQIAANNRITFSGSRDARSRGYRPCKVCRP